MESQEAEFLTDAIRRQPVEGVPATVGNLDEPFLGQGSNQVIGGAQGDVQFPGQITLSYGRTRFNGCKQAQNSTLTSGHLLGTSLGFRFNK